jgi:hypothetical protein
MHVKPAEQYVRQNEIPRLSRLLNHPAQPRGEAALELDPEVIKRFVDKLQESVRLRVENIPPAGDR